MGRCATFWSKLSILDFIGRAPQLNLNGTPTRKTPIGGLLALVLIGVLIAYLVRIIIEISNTQSPTVSIITEYTGLHKRMSIVDNNLLPAFGLYQISKPGEDGSIITGDQLKEYVHFRALWTSYYAEDENSDLQISVREYEIKPCGQLKNKKPYSLFYNDKQVKNRIDETLNCLEIPEDDPVNIEGAVTSLNSTTVKIYAYPAPRDTSVQQDPPITELGILTYGAFNFVKLNDFKKPIKSNVTNNHAFFLSHESQTLMKVKMKATNLKDIIPFEIVTQKPGEVLWNTEAEVHIKSSTKNYYESCKKSVFDTDRETYYNLCPYYGSIDYATHGQEVYLTRKYPDLIQGISQVGGMKEILFIAFGIIYSYYNLKKIRGDLNSRVITKHHKQILSEIIEENSTQVGDGEESEAEIKKKHARIINEVKNLSDELMMRNTNMATIVQELGVLMHIKNLLFDPIQLALLPLVSIQNVLKTRGLTFDEKVEEEAKKLATFVDLEATKPENSRIPTIKLPSKIQYKDSSDGNSDESEQEDSEVDQADNQAQPDPGTEQGPRRSVLAERIEGDTGPVIPELVEFNSSAKKLPGTHQLI
jgi:hypothetical protein